MMNGYIVKHKAGELTLVPIGTKRPRRRPRGAAARMAAQGRYIAWNQARKAHETLQDEVLAFEYAGTTSGSWVLDREARRRWTWRNGAGAWRDL